MGEIRGMIRHQTDFHDRSNTETSLRKGVFEHYDNIRDSLLRAVLCLVVFPVGVWCVMCRAVGTKIEMQEKLVLPPTSGEAYFSRSTATKALAGQD